MDQALVYALFGAVGCGLAGLVVPTLIGRIPEPATPAADKPAYAALAAAPLLPLGAALASAVVGGVLGWALAAQTDLIVWWPLVPIGVALAVVDWRTRLLPTRVIAPTYALVLVCLAVAFVVDRDTADLIRAGWGWLIAGGLFLLLWAIYPRGMGYGDVRLSGILGLALGHVGWAALITGLYAGFVLGALIGGVLSLARLVDRKGYPFGPFMLLGALSGVVVAHLLPGLAWA